MRLGRTVGSALVMSTLLLAALVAQQPARDTPIAAVSGTASVVGSVEYDETPARPVRRAAVTVTNVENDRAVRTYTDDAGQFRLSGLPAGRYLLSALKAGQVTMTYGSPRPGLPGSALVLAEGQKFSSGVLKMTRGAVITGVVLGATGRPVQGVTVAATPFQIVAGERRPLRSLTPGYAGTDDRGIYRIFGLTPATYLVSVSTRFNNASGDLAQPTDAEYRFAADPSGSGSAPPPGPRVVFAPVIFPGVADEASATPVTVSAGEERSGVDIQMKLWATAKVTGMLTGLTGPSISAARLFAPGGSVLGDQLALGARETIGDGTFTIPGVPPGTYQLIAAAAPMSPTGALPPSASLWAMTEIQVSGSDVAGVTLALQPMLTLSGTVVFTDVPKPPEGVRMSFRLLASTPQLIPGGQGAATPEGTLTIGGVIPGTYRLQVNQLTPGWYAKSAMLNGKDMLDAQVDIRPGADVSGLVVTMAPRLSEIAGAIVDGKGAPVPRFFVQVFPVDQTLWFPESRRIKNARASTDGSFSIPNLPAGEYYLCALTEYDPTMASDPSFLGPLVSGSIKITLGDGEKKTQILKLAGAGGTGER